MQADDIPLIRLAQAGDTRAFEQLVRDLEPPLRRYLNRLVNGHAIADDVLQETFLRIWRGLRWLDNPALLTPWAYRIATREAQRAMGREHKREQLDAGADALDLLAAPFDDPALRLDAEACLHKVSPAARVVLAAHFFEGFTLDEVAAIAEAPVGTIKSRLASGLRQLRTLMSVTP